MNPSLSERFINRLELQDFFIQKQPGIPVKRQKDHFYYLNEKSMMFTNC